MTTGQASPETVRDRVARVRTILGETISRKGTDRLKERWANTWSVELDNIEAQSVRRPEVAISLVGGTGAGKSTLVNAIVGVRLLPVSNMRACTAAISEVSYGESGSYEAGIDFISRESWQHEVDMLLQDISDETAVREASDHDAQGGDAVRVSRAAKDKLKVVYGLDDETFTRPLDFRQLKEPPGIAEAMDRGTISFADTDLEAFRKKVKLYLDSKEQYWPVVKTVRIRGPFDSLICGAKLVDLPGINDPNEAREQVTKDYLKTCRFVWIVFSTKRVLTKDVKNLMQTDDFARQVVMDGRQDALTLIGTHSDDIDIQAAKEEFSLSEDACELEAVRARNDAAKKEVRGQLRDIAERLARNAGEDGRAVALIRSFEQSKTFIVSARDYLHHVGAAKNKYTIIENLDDTQIPALRRHMESTCSAYGTESQARAMHGQLLCLLNGVKSVLHQEQASLRRQTELTAKQRKEMSEAIDRLHNFLDRDLAEHERAFEQDLTGKHDLLQERMRRAIDRARNDLDQITDGWRHIHWATLRAIARRGGVYVSGASGRHDLAADIAKPVLNGITFAWTDFFGDKLEHALEVGCDRIFSLAERHRLSVVKNTTVIGGEAVTLLHKDLEGAMESMERVVRELMGQARSEMTGKMEDVRRTLYEQIPGHVRASMRPAFEAASAESGRGMKDRMVGILADRSRSVSGVMFDDADRSIMEGVRSLNDWLATKYREMTRTALRHFQLPVDNIAVEPPSGKDAEAMIAQLQECDGAVQDLRQDPILQGGASLSRMTSTATATPGESVRL
jgi:ribosomal protein S18